MTTARVSRVETEVVHQDPDPNARVSRVATEVVHQDPDPQAQVSRVVVEVVQALSMLELRAVIAGGSSVTPTPTVPYVSEVMTGTSTVTATLDLLGTAGFEIPYLVGLGGKHTVELATLIGGQSAATALLTAGLTFAAISAGSSTVTANLSALGPEELAARITGTSTITAEIFVNGIRNLAATINGTSTVTATSITAPGNGFDPRTASYMYFYINVGVGFDPTDVYPGAVAQVFPDGHTRDDFHEYLYLLLSVGVGFDPTDDASDHPNFVSQTFPDGHTAFDFHEYLYLYLNVVRGRLQRGQLVIRPGFTKGAILPPAKPPRIEPQ